MGLDIETAAIEKARERVPADIQKSGQIALAVGDARSMHHVETGTFDLVTLHPPYLNIVHYGMQRGNLSRHESLAGFLLDMAEVLAESFRVLREGGVLAVLVGDVRRNGEYIPLGFRVLDRLLALDVGMKEHVIKVQWNCSSTSRWSGPKPFLLIQHEHLFVVQKRRRQ